MNTIDMTVEMIPSEKTFIEWVALEDPDFEMTDKEAGMLLGYVSGHGCGVCLDATGTMILVDIEAPENGVLARGIEALIERVSEWNYEFIQESEVVGAYREEILEDAKVIEALLGDLRVGHFVGTPTVKELIAVLSQLPEDYRVTCCGADGYVHIFADQKYITIDSEQYLT